MIISHSDADHAGGALAVMDAVKVGWVASSLWPAHPIVRAARRTRAAWRASAGAGTACSSRCCSRRRPATTTPALKPNARGCTLRVSAGEHAMLLAADIEAAQEAQLVAACAGRLRADVLLAPHHGSGTSSTPAFLRAVQPALGDVPGRLPQPLPASQGGSL